MEEDHEYALMTNPPPPQQQEDQVIGSPRETVPLLPPSPLPQRNDAENLGNQAGRVRLNAIRNSIVWSNNTNSPRSLFFLTSALLPQVAVAAVFLTKYPQETCTETDTFFSLRLWVEVDALLKFLQILLMWSPLIVLYVLRAQNDTIISFLHFKRLASLMLEVSALVWVVQGSNFFFRNDHDSTGCLRDAPHILQLGQTMFLISMLFLSFPILLCMIFIPVLCCCFPCFVRFLLAMRIVNPSGAQIQGVSQEVLDQLPQKRFDGTLFADTENATCAICLQSYLEGDAIRELPCDPRHHFHVQCVDDWLKLNATCPVCRKPLAPNTAATTSNSDEEEQRNATTTSTQVNEEIEDDSIV